MNDEIMNMPKGWVVCYEDGTVLTEYDVDGNERPWKSIPKVGIRSLSIKWYNRHWTIYGKSCYFQYKHGWISPVAGVDLHPNLEERCIGYWDGGEKVCYHVDEQSGKMWITVESAKPAESVGE